MRNLTTAGILLALAAAAEARPAPPELMASVAITTGAGLQSVRDLANAFKPGAGALLTDAMLKTVIANVAHATSLDGLDTVGWSYLLVADGGDVAILGKISDDKLLHSSIGKATMVAKDHWALVGPKAVVDKLSGYALDVLAKEPTPVAPLATVYIPNVMARYKSKLPDIKAAMMQSGQGQQMADFLAADIDAMVAVANDTEKVVLGVSTTQAGATIDLALLPFANSKLSKFVGVQKPSTFAMLDKLPPTQAGVLLAGHLETGPYRDGVLDLMMKMYSLSVGSDLGTAVSTVMKAATGELAMTADLKAAGGGFAITQVFGLTDAKLAEGAIAHIVDLFKTPKKFQVMNYGTTLTTTPNLPSHDGVTIRGYEIAYDFSKLPADQKKKMDAMFPSAVRTRVAVFDGIGAFVMAPSPDAETSLVIDTARGKGSHFTPSKPVADLLAAAIARKDSLAFVMDFASLTAALGKGPSVPGASAPVVVALGFADKQFHMRFATTFATIKTLAHTGP